MRTFTGTTASGGLIIGPVVRIDRGLIGLHRIVSDPYQERALYDAAIVLAKDELAEISGFGRSARIPGGAVRYVSKKDAFSLRPYLWPTLTINGWTMDENGIAVEAGDEDDDFI